MSTTEQQPTTWIERLPTVIGIGAGLVFVGAGIWAFAAPRSPTSLPK